MDKIFPGPVPDQAGVQIKLWHHKLTVLIQMPGLNRGHGTIRKQLDMDYKRIDFDRYLAGLHNYEPQDLFRMGKVFKQTLRSGSSTRKLLLFLRRWL